MIRGQRFGCNLATLAGVFLLLSQVGLCLTTAAQGSDRNLVIQRDDGRLVIHASDPGLQKIVEFFASREASAIYLRDLDPMQADAISRVPLPIDKLISKFFPGQSFVLIHGPGGSSEGSINSTIETIIFLDRSIPSENHTQPPVDQAPYALQTALPEIPLDRESLFALLEEFAQSSTEDHPAVGDNDIQGGELSLSPQSMPDKLMLEGAALSTITVNPRDAKITLTVDLGEDLPLATHAMRRSGTSSASQLTFDGTWISWDGSVETLADNGFAESGRKLTFDLFNGDLSSEYFPINYTVAYLTEAGLKFGVFQVMPHETLVE
ncbi:MAG: hypothetical protein O7I42_24745 [Alphaproteobacteria bacterium]|nr:hypothetical protein [Alphaproteobacteria bacterium]